MVFDIEFECIFQRKQTVLELFASSKGISNSFARQNFSFGIRKPIRILHRIDLLGLSNQKPLIITITMI